jgi:hypothetical protein
MGTQQTQSALLRSARYWAGQLTSLVKSNAPQHLKGGISSSARESEAGVISITIEAKGKDAHAQEYGSGLHAQYRAKKKYPIEPKNKTYLAFFWEKANPGIPKLPDGRVILQHIEHPGINPYVGELGGKGFIRPAIKQFRKEIKNNPRIMQPIRDAILGDIKKAFTDTGGK